MFPSLDLDTTISKVEKNTIQQNLGTSFLFDFTEGDFVIRDGKLVKAEDIEAIKVWIEKILRTEKFKFKIYEKEDINEEYGITIKKLIMGKKLPFGFIRSELKREITEALLKHPMIVDINNFRTIQERATLKVFFTVNLEDGRTFDQEVNI
ncbi:DUF2634 domain-containing protein [Crassaminicella thermophila]|uniref:DUF2634 domain-containing protein n=1 Tax=Crassaminicella thermophila TaxID=2599308 RepID=A0A5C0SDF9_CRATE|nr:DUF2634 domain-containing protein [Crassaminicella thermophila]QEK12573.1 DUF2634 domain-containing protein [Crassaminicella thermophila]